MRIKRVHDDAVRNGVLCGLCLILIWAPARGQGLDATPSLGARTSLEEMLTWSSKNDPGLQEMRHQIAAQSEQARLAGALPDLKIGYSEMLVPVETRVGPQQRAFSLAQSIPWFGTLGLKRQVLDEQVVANEARLLDKQNALHREIRTAWYRLAHLQHELELVEQHWRLANDLAKVTQAAYESGKESYVNLLQARSDGDRLKVRLDNLADREIQLARDLALVAGFPSVMEPPRATLDPLNLAPDGRSDPAALVDRNNPGLQAQREVVQSARTGQRLAAKSGMPDLTLGLDYIMTGEAANPSTPDSGKDPVIARFGLSVPLWGGKAAAEKAGAASRISVVQSTYQKLRRALLRQLDEALYRDQAALRNARLYQDTLLPRGRQEFEVTAAAYQAGQADFTRYVAARRGLLDLELAYWQTQLDLCLARNDLVTLTGGEQALRPVSMSPENETKE